MWLSSALGSFQTSKCLRRLNESFETKVRKWQLLPLETRMSSDMGETIKVVVPLRTRESSQPVKGLCPADHLAP